MKKELIISLALGLLLFSGALLLGNSEKATPFSAFVTLNDDHEDGFSRADGSLRFLFPEDFGPHADFQTEWWYYTGNLEDSEGRHFGYQLTFFRRALIPEALAEARESEWASNHIYMAHFALNDTQEGQFYAFERFSREGVELAGATSLPFQVWLEDWRVEQIDSSEFILFAKNQEIEIELLLSDDKGPSLHGNQGYSQKGPESGNASYYYSQSRLASEGTIQIGEETFDVSGQSWKDHEFSTSALSAGQIGWDWFSIQLDDQRDLMLFQIRRDDGSIDPYSAASIILENGRVISLSANQFSLEAGDHWESPHSGAQYPLQWEIKIPSQGIELYIVPLIKDQELNLSFIYWEGAVRVEGLIDGKAVTGMGYIEMTGYAASMEGQF
jgi:predicted secreted hydrolase